MTIHYPPPPNATDLLKPFELIGPQPAPPNYGRMTTCYRIIDRRNVTGDGMHRVDEYIERTPVRLIVMGDDAATLAPLAKTLFAEFQRRFLYAADQQWLRDRDAVEARSHIVEILNHRGFRNGATPYRFGHWYRTDRGLSWIEGSRYE